MERRITALVGKLNFIMRLDKATRWWLSIIALVLAIVPYILFYFLDIPNTKFLGFLAGFAVYIYGHYENADNTNITRMAIMFIIASSVLGIFEDKIIINNCIYKYHTISVSKILSISQGRGYSLVTYKFCHKNICVENIETISKDRSKYLPEDSCFVDFNNQNLNMSHIYPKGIFPNKATRKNVVAFSWQQLERIYQIILLIVLLGFCLGLVYFFRNR